MQREHLQTLPDGTPHWKTVGRALCLSVIAIAAVACGSGIGSTDPVTVSRFITGTVVGVDSSSSAICLRPDSGAGQLCGIPLQRPGAPRLTVGQSVGVAIASIATGKNGNRIETMIVYMPPPEP